MSTIKYNPTVVKTGNAQAKGLEEDGAQSKAELTRAKGTLATLQNTKAKTPGEKAALTKVINRLSEAIQLRGTASTPGNRPDMIKIAADEPLPGRGGGRVLKVTADEPLPGRLPGGGGGRVLKVTADEPFPGGGGGRVFKVAADEPLPRVDDGIRKIRADEPLPGRGGHGPNGPQGRDVIFKVRADDPLPGEGTKLSSKKQTQLKQLTGKLEDAGNIQWKQGGFIQSQPVGSQRYETLKIRDDRPVDGVAITAFVRAGQLNAPGDPNQAKEFFLERESLRGGKSWAGPFPIKDGKKGV